MADQEQRDTSRQRYETSLERFLAAGVPAELDDPEVGAQWWKAMAHIHNDLYHELLPVDSDSAYEEMDLTIEAMRNVRRCERQLRRRS